MENSLSLFRNFEEIPYRLMQNFCVLRTRKKLLSIEKRQNKKVAMPITVLHFLGRTLEAARFKEKKLA